MQLDLSRGASTRFPKEYSSWRCMKRRCFYPKDVSYKYVGGRGLGMYEPWRLSFTAFLADVGLAPSPTHTIDRYPDNNRGYFPDNVRWATPLEQQINSSKAVFLEHNGERLCLSEWSRKTGIPVETISCRVRRFGWPAAAALSFGAYKRHRPARSQGVVS